MKNVITISRETGSGGHSVGELLAKELGYDFYDAEIVEKTAVKLRAGKEEIQSKGEFMDEETEFNLASGIIPYNFFSRKQKIPFDRIYDEQKKLISDIAEKGNCVIVGRNSDAILKDNENAFHVFIHAPMNHRVKRVLLHEHECKEKDLKDDGKIIVGNTEVPLEEDETKTAQENRIRHELELKDKSRGAHYSYFTNRTWGMVSNYNLMVDTGVLTEKQCCSLIIEALQKANENAGGN